MELFYQRSGNGDPVFVIHGLFGSLENLGLATKSLSEHYDVIAPDVRNHGRSPHSEDCSYRSMAGDILDLADKLGIEKFNLLGHSMGGKIAMEAAMIAPARVKRLIAVDIAPVQYPPHHDDVFEGLLGLDLTQIRSRSMADQALQSQITDPGVRAFLLKNLIKDETGQFTWRMNLEGLKSNYSQIAAAVSDGQFDGPVMFIKGGQSNYLLEKHQTEIIKRFPKTSLKIMEQTGHWPHAEKPKVFIKLVERFLET